MSLLCSAPQSEHKVLPQACLQRPTTATTLMPLISFCSLSGLCAPPQTCLTLQGPVRTLPQGITLLAPHLLPAFAKPHLLHNVPTCSTLLFAPFPSMPTCSKALFSTSLVRLPPPTGKLPEGRAFVCSDGAEGPHSLGHSGYTVPIS